MTRLSDAQKEQIVALREKGKRVTFIASRVGCSEGSVLYHCLRNGLDPFDNATLGRRGKGAFSEEEDARLIALEESGMKLHHIAATLNRPRTSTRMRLMLLCARAEKALGQ